MRKVRKSHQVPASLQQLADPVKPEDIDDNLYTQPDTKAQLRADQYNKCVYCECLLNGDYGDVEHFRPKKGYTLYPSNGMHKPGYYWLAYRWSNLLLSCSTCNTSYKKNHFVLADEATRNIAGQDISREVPLLINPSKENPARFIEFHAEVVAPRLEADGTESRKGRHTIDVLQLNGRPVLLDSRKRTWLSYQKWRKMKALCETLFAQGISTIEVQEMFRTASNELQRMQAPCAEYSGMLVNNTK